jgi:hypothetical protein
MNKSRKNNFLLLMPRHVERRCEEKGQMEWEDILIMHGGEFYKMHLNLTNALIILRNSLLIFVNKSFSNHVFHIHRLITKIYVLQSFHCTTLCRKVKLNLQLFESSCTLFEKKCG